MIAERKSSKKKVVVELFCSVDKQKKTSKIKCSRQEKKSNASSFYYLDEYGDYDN